jgi:WD40 repeat protein
LEETRALFDAGRKIDPANSSLYDAMAEYLLPRWHGQPGDVEKLAAEMVREMPGDDGLDAYLLIAYAVNQFDSNILFWGEFDRELLSKSAEVGVKRHPQARNIVPFCALCTIVAQDRAADRRIRPAVKYNDAFRVWLWALVSADFFLWCDEGEIAAKQSEWIWGTPRNFPSLAFSADSRTLWSASGSSPVAITQWNLETKKVESVLPTQGKQIEKFVVDSNQRWIAAIVGGEQHTGWLLWDATQPNDDPYYFAMPEASEAIAIGGTPSAVAFSDGKTVRTIELATENPGPSVTLGERVVGITTSADGRSILAWDESFCVWDVAAGKKLYELPRTGSAEVGVEKILDIDAEGQTWAVVYVAGVTPPKRSLVRFAPDGKSWQTLLADLQALGPIQPLTAVLSPNRRLLVASDQAKPGDSATFQVWNVASGQSERLAGHRNHIGSFAFSPDCSKLASVSAAGGPLKVWILPAQVIR